MNKFRIIINLVVLLAINLTFANTLIVPNKTAQKVIVFDYPPYMNKTLVDGKKGLEVDVFEYAAQDLGVNFEYLWLPIARAVSTMKETKEDNDYVYIGTSKHFEKEIEKKDFVAFNFGIAKFVPFTLKEKKHLVNQELNIEKLKKHKVAALRGSSVVAYLKSVGIQPMEVHSFDAFFQALINNRVDYSIVLDISGEEHMRKSGLDVQTKITKLNTSIYEIPLAIVISKTHPNLSKIYNSLDSNVKKMKTNGDLTKIAEAYYGVGKVPQDFYVQ